MFGGRSKLGKRVLDEGEDGITYHSWTISNISHHYSLPHPHPITALSPSHHSPVPITIYPLKASNDSSLLEPLGFFLLPLHPGEGEVPP